MASGDDGFDFLGFHHRMVMSQRFGWKYCHRWPSRRAMAAIRSRIKAITAPRSRLKWPIDDLVRELNPVLRGWGAYFRWGNSSRKFAQVDSYVHERLALFDSKKRQKRGRRWGKTPPTPGIGRWGFTASLGRSAASARCDRGHVNTVGEPDEGKPHVRFDEGRLARFAGPAAYSAQGNAQTPAPTRKPTANPAPLASQHTRKSPPNTNPPINRAASWCRARGVATPEARPGTRRRPRRAAGERAGRGRHRPGPRRRRAARPRRPRRGRAPGRRRGRRRGAGDGDAAPPRREPGPDHRRRPGA